MPHTTLFQAGSIRLSFGVQGLQRFLELATVKEFTVLSTLYDRLLRDDKKSAITENSALFETQCAVFVIIHW